MAGLASFDCTGPLFIHRLFDKPPFVYIDVLENQVLMSFFSYFTAEQVQPLPLAFALLIVSLAFFLSERHKPALWLLFAGSLALGYFMIRLDPFLVIWDEQYHALVARSMLDNPFRPVLYANPVLGYHFQDWTSNHVWLHKQPLFLWEMALSMKLFGVNEVSVRLPGVLQHALIALVVYRLGSLTVGKATGYYAALFFTLAWFPLEMTAGKFHTDHNDVSFMFYVVCSFWAWFEYRESGHQRWLILIGLFSGCAILVKWLTGLLVYAAWGWVLLRGRFRIHRYSVMLLPLVITVAVALPWQLYVYSKYPVEAAYEMALNTRHFFEVIENHGGGILFHYNASRTMYGTMFAMPFLIAGGWYLLFRNARVRAYPVFMFAATGIIYVFYTLAATKMIAFTMVVAPLFYLALGELVRSVLDVAGRINRFQVIIKMFQFVVILWIGLLLLNLPNIRNYHTHWKPHDNFERAKDLELMEWIRSTRDTLTGNEYVIFNTGLRLNGQISVMFYTGCTAYDFVPDTTQIRVVHEAGHKIAVWDNGHLPTYLMEDKDVVLIRPRGWKLSTQ